MLGERPVAVFDDRLVFGRLGEHDHHRGLLEEGPILVGVLSLEFDPAISVGDGLAGAREQPLLPVVEGVGAVRVNV